MGAIVGMLAGLLGRLSFGALLGQLARLLALVGIPWFIWRLDRVGTVDKVAVSTGKVATGVGDVAAAGGSIATTTGRVADATAGLSSDALLILGGGVLLLFLL